MTPYIYHIALYDLAFLGAIFIGLTFILLLWFTKKAVRSANRFLARALAVAVLWIARLLAASVGLSAYVGWWSRLPLQFSLALGPLIFFYVLKITRPEYQFRRRDLLHFSPLLLELSAYGLETLESIKTGVATYDIPLYQRLHPVVQLLAFISVTYYLYRCHRLIENFYRQQKFSGGDRYRQELRWLHQLLTAFALLWLLWIPLTAADYFFYNFQLSAQAYFPLYLVLTPMIIWIAASAFSRPEISMSSAKLPFSAALPAAELKQKGSWLKKTVKENRYYQDPELSLASLAEKLGLHPHELSRIINTVLKKSFNDFINEYRVHDVICKMQDPAYDHITLLGIAYDAGFNSRTTFHRTFKQMTGKSPAEYKSEQKKGIPSYNLEHHQRFATVISNQLTTPKWPDKKLNRSYMFENYLKIAWRSIHGNKVYTSINILGLSLGVCACLIIYLITSFELSYDTFHPGKDRIYRIVTSMQDAQGNKGEAASGIIPYP